MGRSRQISSFPLSKCVVLALLGLVLPLNLTPLPLAHCYCCGAVFLNFLLERWEAEEGSALHWQHQPTSSELSEVRRAGPWSRLCPRLHAHPFETAQGMLKHLSHAYSSCLLRRQTRQADQEREGRCICSWSGALVLLSQTQLKILKDAQRWFAMEITAGSHPQCLGVCVRVHAHVRVCVHKPKANATWLPTSSHDAGVKAPPLLVRQSVGKDLLDCWIKAG